MLSYSKIGNITITCHKRVAPYLAEEVEELGFEVSEVFMTGVKLKGTLNDCIKLNLHLRCASQVLFSLYAFQAENADEIYDAAKKIAWEDMLPINTYLTITSSVKNDTINNSMFANVRVKDAIVDRLRYKLNRRPNTGADPVGAVVHLFWKGYEAELFLDTSGHSLGRHGYRKNPGKAPMLESLAAATIRATKWDRKSPFLNPMCGSGTLAIEAALLATNRYPGLFRDNYGFMHFKGYDETVYEAEMEALKKGIIEVPDLQIIASDYSRFAITNTKENAFAAGVRQYITTEVRDFEKSTIPESETGVIMMNPEYGLRLGEIDELELTYKRIGDFLKQQCAGYTAFIFTGNLDLAKKIGLKASRRIEFYNSKIDCRLLKFELYKGSREKVTENE